MQTMSRRRFLKVATLGMGAALLETAGCAPTPTETPPTAPTLAPQPITATSTVAPPTVAPTTIPATSIPPTPAPLLTTVAPTATSVPPAGQAPAPTTSLAARMNQAASRFLDALSADQRDRASFAFNDTAERHRWHWTTPAGFPRHGLPLKEMNAEQRALALDLLRASSSEAGHQKVLDIIALQKDLRQDPDLYYVSLFDEPGKNPWGWRFEGHHISRQYTIVGEQVAVTPLFLGSWPSTSEASLRALGREEDAAREIIRALTGPARDQAMIQSNTLTTHVTMNQARVSPLASVGIAYGDLAAEQQDRVREILRAYLAVQPDAIAAQTWARIEAGGLDRLRFGWAGSLEPRRPHYYRIQGPTFLLEFDNSRNGGTHVHSVWRDFEQNYAYHLL